MDKQKQIEEMANCLIGKEFSYANGTKLLGVGYTAGMEIASVLVNAGYRKIHENAVVLTREEYQMLNYFNHRGEELLKQERKETAEKFAERLKKECYEDGIDDKWVAVSFSRLDEIVKELGGENG